MSDKTWTLTFTSDGRVGSKPYDSEEAFVSGVRDRLVDLRSSDISAVLPDGTKLDEAELRAKYG